MKLFSNDRYCSARVLFAFSGLLGLFSGPGAYAQDPPNPYDPPSALYRVLPEAYGVDSEDGDDFGYALEQGDFDGNNVLDLAIGMPGRGMVFIQYDAAETPFGPRYDVWTDPYAAASGCGRSLAAGDLDGDGYDDLAIGCPEGNHVRVLRGGALGLDVLDLLPAVLPNCSEAGEQTLEAGRFGGAVLTVPTDSEGPVDFRSKLVVGAPDGQLASMAFAGGFVAEYELLPSGRFSCLGAWHQGIAGIDATLEAGDGFGYSLGAGDFDGDDRVDLVVGAPFERIESEDAPRAGAISVLWGQSGMMPFEVGAADILNTVNQSILGSDHLTGAELKAETNDLFGYAVEGFRWYDFDMSPGPRCDWIMVGAPGDELDAYFPDRYSGTITSLGRHDFDPCSRHVLSRGVATVIAKERRVSGIDWFAGGSLETWRYDTRDYTLWGFPSERSTLFPVPGRAYVARERSEGGATDGFNSPLNRSLGPGCDLETDCPITNHDEFGRGLAILGRTVVAVSAPNSINGRTGQQGGAVFVFVD